MAVDHEAIAMTDIEKMYPGEAKRFDDLCDKENQETLTKDEALEMGKLSKLLESEFHRCVMHYKLNWPLSSQELRQEWIDKGKEWRKGNPIIKN